MTQSNIPSLELKNLTKKYGDFFANKDLSLSFYLGKITAIVGENGAGKSTLFKIATGLLQPDDGEIIINGRKIRNYTSKIANMHGIGMVHQHFLLIPSFSVLDNILLGHEISKWSKIDYKKSTDIINSIAKKLNFSIDLNKKVEDLTIGEKQNIEIIKILYRNNKILILDEPTAVLTPQESSNLFSIFKLLANEGYTIIFVTHKLQEVLNISDDIYVIRQGQLAGYYLPKDVTIEFLAEQMIGKLDIKAIGNINNIQKKERNNVLSISNLSVKNKDGLLKIKKLSLNIMQGEILGVASIQGNGESELIDCIAGLLNYNGDIFFLGNNINGKNVSERIQLGISHIPEDRHKKAVILSLSNEDNIIIGSLDKYKTGKIFLDRKKIKEDSATIFEKYDIYPKNIQIETSNLSGGNQQKLVVGREVEKKPLLLLAGQPSRGVDIKSSNFIHNTISSLRSAGTAVLLVSSDLNELLSLSDRIIVLYKGEIVANFAKEEANETLLGLFMSGSKVDINNMEETL